MSGAHRRVVHLAEGVATSPAGARFVLDPLVGWGWRRYSRDGTTPPLAYRVMRLSFLAPQTSFKRLEDRAANEVARLSFSAAPIGLVADIHTETLAALRRDGFVVLPSLLSAAACDDIERCARAAECTMTGIPGEVATFDVDAPRARRYDIPEADLLASGSVQDLMADESLLRLAQDYFGAAPVQDMVAAWWSAPGGGSASEAAQMYHFDLDRVRFLKLFVYLTDVGPDTGPHSYVRGTHLELPSEFRHDRRYTDAEVEERYRTHVVRIPGPRGTVFLADTRGLHKGESVIRGHRLVFQMELASSLFGQTYTRPTLSASSTALAEAARRFPGVFRRFAVADG
jgi:hypothetical protein